jgi:hypothetical protein
LVNQRTVWCQRIHAELYHRGVAVPEGAIRTVKTRAMLADTTLQLSRAARARIAAGYRMIDATDLEAQPLKRELQCFGARQPACRALVDAQYGIGGLIAVAVWSELGDCRRFCRSAQVVRHTGLDVTVDSSDRRRAGGFLSRQGPETLRWALYEAAKNTSHHRSPDHHYYAAVKERHDGKIAAISVARQFARRCYHVLRSAFCDTSRRTRPRADRRIGGAARSDIGRCDWWHGSDVAGIVDELVPSGSTDQLLVSTMVIRRAERAGGVPAVIASRQDCVMLAGGPFFGCAGGPLR